MTQRLKGVYVAFEQDIREDDAESIINAIRMIRNVAGVQNVESNPEDWINRSQIKMQLRNDVLELWKGIDEC